MRIIAKRDEQLTNEDEEEEEEQMTRNGDRRWKESEVKVCERVPGSNVVSLLKSVGNLRITHLVLRRVNRHVQLNKADKLSFLAQPFRRKGHASRGRGCRLSYRGRHPSW